MSVATNIYPSAKAAAEACAMQAASLLEDAIRKSGRATFALSGSTPAHMIDALAAMPLDWTRIPFPPTTDYSLLREELSILGPDAIFARSFR